MRDGDCVSFLQWCLPRMGLRWRGFRRVRGTVCKRVSRRLRELGLSDVGGYRDYLIDHPDEWVRLEEFCRIPISRFWRDRAVFDWLAETALPRLAAQAATRGDGLVRCWSAGCASGEEAYSVRMAWAQHAERACPEAGIEIIATDVDRTMIDRARAGRYEEGSFRDLPAAWRESGFTREGETFLVRDEMRDGVTFVLQDLLSAAPDGLFDLVLCRNVAFTYFDADGQREALARIASKLRPEGLLVIGGHEELPGDALGFEQAADAMPVYRRARDVSASLHKRPAWAEAANPGPAHQTPRRT
jgi:chemotaxis protein methyltransferase CheR